MKYLYNDGLINRYRKRLMVFAVLTILLAASGSAGCIIICRKLNPVRYYELLFKCIAHFTVTGWLVIYITERKIFGSIHAIKHIRLISDGCKEEISGFAEPVKGKIYLPHSVTCRSIKMHCADRTRTVFLCAIFNDYDKIAGRNVRLLTVHGFIAGYEEVVENG